MRQIVSTYYCPTVFIFKVLDIKSLVHELSSFATVKTISTNIYIYIYTHTYIYICVCVCVCASHSQPAVCFDAGTCSCKRRHIKTCKFVTNFIATHIGGPEGSFNVIETLACISEDIVCGIICKRYHIIDIWESGRRLANRITEHIRSIRNNIFEFPVAQYFNSLSHFSLNDFAMTGIIHCNCSNVNRLNIENRINFQSLNLISPGT